MQSKHCACSNDAPASPMQESGTLRELQALKHVVQEPRQAGDVFDKTIASYYEAIRKGKGGLFVAVCRGKVGLWLLKKLELGDTDT